MGMKLAHELNGIYWQEHCGTNEEDSNDVIVSVLRYGDSVSKRASAMMGFVGETYSGSGSRRSTDYNGATIRKRKRTETTTSISTYNTINNNDNNSSSSFNITIGDNEECQELRTKDGTTIDEHQQEHQEQPYINSLNGSGGNDIKSSSSSGNRNSVNSNNSINSNNHSNNNTKLRIMVSTDLASRGLDVNGITHVINFDLPCNADAYVHRGGRTGRIGNAGTIVSIVTPSQEFVLHRIANELGIASNNNNNNNNNGMKLLSRQKQKKSTE